MISEKIVASLFSGFWSESLPLLTSSFVKVFNEAYCEDLTEIPMSAFSNIEISQEVEKHDLVAEFSFCAAEAIHSKGLTEKQLEESVEEQEKVQNSAVSFLKRYQDQGQGILLNKTELQEALKIASQYNHFFNYLKLNHNEINFRPKLKGAGFLGLCTADLATNNTLYEVKTVSRNLSGKDIRQLLIYLALQSEADKKQWDYAGFFNPRKALHYRFSVDHLIYRTSGGRTRSEVFESIINFLDFRGIELDTPF